MNVSKFKALLTAVDLGSFSAAAQKLGYTWAEYFSRGTVPLPQLALFERAWNLLIQVRTDRDGRPNHSMDVDSDTGEVFEESSELPKNSLQSDDEALRWEKVNPDSDFPF
jgi:hypothetical protein